MLQSKYLTEEDLADFGFQSIGRNVRISSDARIYGSSRISIGNNVRIDDFTILSAGDGTIVLGNYVFIARSCHLSGTLGIEMRDFTSMAANGVLYSASDDYSGDHLTAQVVDKSFTARIGGPIIIGRHVILGSAVTVLGPSTIGEGCSVGAISLVNRDLEPWGVYAGIPARRMKERKKNLLEMEKAFLEKLSQT